MDDLLLMYRACGAETRDDYLRSVAHENGLPVAAVNRLADQLGEKEDFDALICRCEMAGGASL
jgi:predicted amidohydrolase